VIEDFISAYWGKAQPKSPETPQWHPLAYHALDVAAVANVLLAKDRRRFERLADRLDVTREDLHRLLVFLIALHDIGKFSRHFQAKSDLGPQGALPPSPSAAPHDDIGYALFFHSEFDLEQILSQFFDVAEDGDVVFAAVAGHHGEPPANAPNHWLNGFCSKEVSDVRAFVGAMVSHFRLSYRLSSFGENTKLMSWYLAGLANVSDWIASSQRWFEYRCPTMSVEDYWKVAQNQAHRAVQDAGILPASSLSDVNPKHLLPQLGEQPLSPLQEAACACALPPGPTLTLIEDVTGAGKTEAALIIAARLMAERRAAGLFFALPTMATANAMYERLAATYRSLFETDATPSLVLAHGKRALHDAFCDSILALAADDARDHARLNTRGEMRSDVTASAACAAWIADDRRKVFLADVGIGTIDQALLGVLPSRFQALRLWGLSDRVLIIDEAHTYDAFVGRELENLLEFHAALGGSAVILSATLSTEARDRLAGAFQRGLGCAQSAIVALDYPLLSVISATEIASQPVGTRPEIARTLAVRRIGTVDEAVRHAVSLANRGACVAWIRNTVDDAVDGANMLRCAGLDPILLHSRFAMVDRLRIEARVQELLGKDSLPEQRRGVAIVGTQILESSLDYDVDGMISDLAPIDMLIQRAGRLWRHPHRNRERPIGEDERAFMLLSPDPSHVVDADWYRALSKGAAAVYSDHGYVWRTATALERTKEISTPGGIRILLAEVYDQSDAPEQLERASLDADGKRFAARSIAANACLSVTKGYNGNNLLWSADDIVATRLSDEPTVAFRLARRENGVIAPWCSLVDAGGSPARAWALSECSVSQRKASGVPEPTGALAEEISAAKALWSRWEREQPLIVLDQIEEGLWQGIVIADKTERIVHYCDALGWRLEPA